MIQAQIHIPYEHIVDFCKKWRVCEFALFGSVLREDFRPDSDVDVLITHEVGARHSLFDRIDMIEELAAIFGRKVDIVTRRGIESSKNSLRCRAILESSQVIHAA